MKIVAVFCVKAYKQSCPCVVKVHRNIYAVNNVLQMMAILECHTQNNKQNTNNNKEES